MSDPQSSSQGSDRAVEHDKVSEPETTTPHDAIASTASSAEPAIISTSAAKNDIASSEDQDIVPVEAAASSSTAPPVAGLKRMQSEALGPAFEDAPLQSTAAATSTILLLTLQLTTGARHPYKIDEKYLTNRKVEAKTDTGEFDPRELSGYKLKELIWTDWRTEWEPRPTNPSSIRLIFMGKLLEDKKPLKDYAFTIEGPSIIHMTVKPAEFDDEETAAKGNKSTSVRAREGEERDAGCRCVIL